MEKIYKVKVTRDSIRGTRESVYEGTLEELSTDVFGYTLEVGHSYDSKVLLRPKTIRSLISNLNKASRIKYGNTYTTETYELV